MPKTGPFKKYGKKPTLDELCRHFQTSPDKMRGQVDTLLSSTANRDGLWAFRGGYVLGCVWGTGTGRADAMNPASDCRFGPDEWWPAVLMRGNPREDNQVAAFCSTLLDLGGRRCWWTHVTRVHYFEDQDASSASSSLSTQHDQDALENGKGARLFALDNGHGGSSSSQDQPPKATNEDQQKPMATKDWLQQPKPTKDDQQQLSEEDLQQGHKDQQQPGNEGLQQGNKKDQQQPGNEDNDGNKDDQQQLGDNDDWHDDWQDDWYWSQGWQGWSAWQ